MSGFRPLRVAALRRETDDAVRITLSPPPGLEAEFAYRQGQHVTLRRVLDGEELRRTYSVCRSEQDRALELVVRRHPRGRFSRFLNDALHAGDTIEALPPSGRFGPQADRSRARRYAAFAAGSGVTPVASIAATTLAAEPECDFTLVCANRETASILMLEDLHDLKDRYPTRFSLVHVLSREPQDVELPSGRIDAAKAALILDRVIGAASVDEFFLCVPRGLLDLLRGALAERGVDERRVHFELFSVAGDGVAERAAAPPEAAAGDAGARVVIVLDGKRTELTVPRGEPILDAALRVRPDIPYSCKAGMCSTCRARLVEGEVEMLENFALEDDEVAAGYVLTCQSVPQTDEVVLDFDG